MRSVVLFAAAVCLPAAVCRGGGLIERGDFEAAEIGALTKTTAASQTHFFLPPPAYFGRVTLADDDAALAWPSIRAAPPVPPSASRSTRHD